MRSLSLAKSPYFHYLEEDENFRMWVEALEQFADNMQSVADEGRYLFTEKVTVERKKSMAKLSSRRGTAWSWSPKPRREGAGGSWEA
jgi:hypothetical protein